MAMIKRMPFLLFIVGMLLLLTSCRMGESDHMTEQQQQQLQTTYDSMQPTYKSLMEKYKGIADSLPTELRSLYSQMQQMHQQMQENHRHMMSMHRNQAMKGKKRMGKGMGMEIQNNMTAEWYHQMKSMHERMAKMHRNMEQQSMADMNKRLSSEFGKMGDIISGFGDSSEAPFNEEGDPSLLNGESLYAQNCASCHGSNGEGVGSVFPPVVSTKWVTGDKSVPVRILLHGLSGEIEVNGQTYRGSMPSYKARLSAAEIAAILNYLRDESNGDYSKISQEDIIRIINTYSNRSTPWSAEELGMD